MSVVVAENSKRAPNEHEIGRERGEDRGDNGAAPAEEGRGREPKKGSRLGRW
jgi:hypothetical protein